LAEVFLGKRGGDDLPTKVFFLDREAFSFSRKKGTPPRTLPDIPDGQPEEKGETQDCCSQQKKIVLKVAEGGGKKRRGKARWGGIDLSRKGHPFR